MSHRRPADPRNVPSPRGPASRPLRAGLAPAAALALGAALVLGAPGEAAAQGVCAGDLPTVPNSNVGGTRIVCQESNPSASGIRINAESVSLSVTSSNFSFRPAIDARLNSASDVNDVNVRLGRGLVITTSAVRNAFIGAYARNAGSGATRVVMEDGASITTTGGEADGIRFSNPTAATGTTDVRMTGGSITTSGTDAHGIHILHNGSGASTIDMSGGAIKASGSLSSGIYVDKQRGSGDATITFSGGSIEKSGGDGAGIGFYGNPAANAANARIRVTGGSIAVEGIANTHGVYVDHRGAGGGDVAMTGGSITTKGLNSHGVFAFLRNAANEAPIVIGMAGGSITTEGPFALGLYGIHQGLGSVTVTMEGEAEITTSGSASEGVSALLDNAANEAAIVVDMAGGSVATEGLSATGLIGFHTGLGSVTVTTGGEAEIETPFAVGVQGRLTNNANAAGRLVVTHGGAVGAGDVGVLAWAARRSGHTSGDGAEEADDAARTEPMIHVTSSGDVTVGAQVTDAFIENRIAGDDGTLSAREEAVFNAIKADDSDALTTALEALPADYDDDWKAEAENLRRKRAVLTDDETSANRAVEKFLGLTRAGVRALALSHSAITGHVRFGDGDDALSAAERTALEAALTGGDLETALAALPAAYTDTWKDTLRAHAASYNEGDIRVDVTGGTITAEGDGVDARYALTHDRNGAITVTVADGAEINGGRHGVHVGGAGLAAGGGLRDQTVTVNGAVMGGTGAGVHLAGGGRVTVGRTGRVGATSGVGILSDGAGGLDATVAGTVEGHVRAQGGGDLAVTVEREGEITGDVRAQDGGDLSATVAGTVKGDLRAMDGGDLDATISGTVEGDLRVMGGGALTVDVQEGGAVTGTVHDPAGPLTVAGSIGRLLYANGGTVTVAATGRLTGVEGESEAIRSESGDLDVTVAGTVASDLRAPSGGALRLDVQEGGAVTGTVHDPAGPLTVHGSIGRLLYTNGGAVMVAATGRLTGVEVEGGREAVRSEAGDLAVTVAGSGKVEGNLRAMDGGDLTVTVEREGEITGDVRAEGGGVLTVDVQEGGAVTGTVHDPASPLTVAGSIGRLLYTSGGAVTVAATGRLTGVEVEGGREAVRSGSGDLAVTVARAGTVTGDVRGLGDGDLRAVVAGTVRGDLVEEGAGDLSATVSGTVEGDLLARGGGALTVDVQEGGAVTGTVHDPAGPLTVAGSIGRILYGNGGAVTVAATGRLTGVEVESGREAVRSGSGDLAVTVARAGMVTGDVRGLGDGDLSVQMAGTIRGDLVEEGAGDLGATISGTVEGNVFGRGAGEHTVTVSRGGTVTGAIHLAASTVTVDGTAGRVQLDNGGTVTVGGTGRLTGVEVEGGREAVRSGSGDLAVTVARAGTVAGAVRGLGDGDLSVQVAGTLRGDLVKEGAGDLVATVSGTVEGDLLARGGGALTVDVQEGGAVTGAVRGLGDGDLSVQVAGTVRGDLVEEGAGDLSATVTGTVEGDVFGRGAGALRLEVQEGGAVTGTVHDPAGPLTVAGSVGRVLYSNGGAVTVAATGRLTGVEGESEAVRSESGDLDVTVAGTVAGDLRAPSGGALRLDVQEGGAVTGTVHDPAGPLTVAGNVGRVLYSNGGAVTVAATGRLTGVEGESEAVRSESGDLDVTVAGTVAGDLRAPSGGALRLDVQEGGAVTGTVHDPAGPLTVAGNVGRVFYSNGGAVTVAATGRLTGVEVESGREAVRSESGDLAVTVARAGTVTGGVRGLGDGDLSAVVAGTLRGDLVEEGAGDLGATVTGTVEGNVFGRGAGEHTVTVSRGGTVTGAIHLAASTVTVDGTAGRVQFDNGGMVRVGGTGRVTGLEGVAVRNAAGALNVTVAAGGRVEGDVVDLGSRPARVTTGPGSAVTGTIDLAGKGSAVTVGGTAGRVRLGGGGTVTVGANGRVTGLEGETITSEQGYLVVVLQQGAGETFTEAFDRISGGGEMRDAGGAPEMRYVPVDGPPIELGEPDSRRSVPEGANDVGIVADGGAVGLKSVHARRSRVYEALPSVLLGLNGPADFQARTSAPRAAHGGWARVEAARGKWKAEGSASRKHSGVGLEYDHRRSGLQAGMDVAAGEEGLLGVSLHHRQGAADVSHGGEIELSGRGVGVSGAWGRDDVYVDVQAEATWYEADFRSSLRGVLKQDAPGRGYALGVEAGRRFALDGAPVGMVLTPRAGLVHSRVSVGGFTDAVGARVSLEEGRSLRGRAGMAVEVEPGGGSSGNRLFGSLDVEREFSKDRKVRVSGTELESEADAMWVRVGLNGSHSGGEGRYALRGGVSWAASGASRELGAGVSLTVRF